MIEIAYTRNEFFELKKKWQEKNSPQSQIGFVPTMGNLHEGHLSLLEKSLTENDLSVMSIFVNPKQFGPNEDFTKYPRTLDEDISKITRLFFEVSNRQSGKEKSIIVFAPQTDSEIYPEGFSTTISVGPVTQILCGKYRPTHFDGVTTVVYCLFKIVGAHNAYFGQKDYQQCVVLQKMINDLSLEIKMHIFPIIRNSEGLALSSRNQYLSESDKKDALFLHRTLTGLKHQFEEHNLEIAMKLTSPMLEEYLKDSRFDYLEILDGNTLSPINERTQKIAILGVLRLSGTRLLDNEVFDLYAR